MHHPLVPRPLCLLLVLTLSTAGRVTAADQETADPPDPFATAQEVDRLLGEEFQKAGVVPAPPASDEDFLRRLTFDLTGTTPSPRDVTLFGLDADPAKRRAVAERLVESDAFARNWAAYWRDVIFERATNERADFARAAFTRWLTEQLEQGTAWDEIATAMITATGDVRAEGATGLIFAHEGDPSEVASEVARVFLGIQVQCANCHDHPTDRWKREDFHELAAFFPRAGVRPKRDGDRQIGFEVVSVNPPPDRGGQRGPFGEGRERFFRFMDRNRDGKLTEAEAAGTPLENFIEVIALQVDADKDGAVSMKEMAALQPPMQTPGRGSAEHYMPNLDDPASRGTKMDPVFFVNGESLPAGRSDSERRAELARLLTSPENPWFARALVNRIWSELLGQGFYTPVDDIGPEREPVHPQVLEMLCRGFVASGHDLKWLFRTITATDAYCRQVRPADPSVNVPFAAAQPTRLRSDQVYSAITEVIGIAEETNRQPPGPGGVYRRGRSPRDAFNELFGFDPSTPQADLTGTVPQALFLMNSPTINSLIEASARTRLGQLLDRFEGDEDALAELYLLVLAREPSAKESAICRAHIAGAKDRGEAFEDILWSLLNSTEFLTKR